MTLSFDLMVIGGGPGGYIAAIRAAQLGMSVACCEYNAYDDPAGEPRLGGTCLNAGCIPLKALVASSEAYEHATTHFAAHGISVSGLSMDVTKMQKRKESIVRRMTAGIQFLFKKNKVTLLKGRGSFVGKSEDGYRLLVAGKEGETEITARNVIIATGSTPRHLPNITVDNFTICDNVGALKFTDVPKRLAIIGAGVIGLEVGSVWRRLGADVTLLEMLPTLLPFADESIASEAAKLFKKQGLNIATGVSIGDIKQELTGVSIAYSDKDGTAQTLECDKLILSIGRTPNSDGLNLEAVDLQPDARGFIPVNEQCATTIHGIYAIGDVVRGPMLAHKAEDEGVMVAEVIAGQNAHINYNAIPSVIYTSPEMAWVGQSEQQLRADGRTYKAGQFPYGANGRAQGLGAPEGFIKMIADAESDKILGVHCIGASASELIGEATLAMEMGITATELARTCHAHPTLSEVMREAALAVHGRALNV